MELLDWAGVLAAVAPVVAIAGGVLRSARRRARARRRWATLARERGWSLTEERLRGREVTTLRGSVGRAKLLAVAMDRGRDEDPPGADRVGGTWVVLELATPLDLGLIVVAGSLRGALADRQGPAATMVDALLDHAWPGTRLDGEDVRFHGDPDFDRDFIVRARDAAGATRLLDPQARAAIRGVLESSPVGAVTDGGALVVFPEPHAELDAVLAWLAELEQRLGRR
ncbi:MAG: hypothetical protein IT376_17930 [Polyangiaceae bacterium]|nr:hypothetical protein [Polyangiaceae bacterium]